MAGLNFKSAEAMVSLHTGLPSTKYEIEKHNVGMASALIASADLEAKGKGGLAPFLSFVAQRAPLPNPSVELTNCSKLQFAAHLERWASQ